MDGYHYTWDAMQGYTKANERVRFPAFYYAAQYSPAVTGTNISKWFFPSIGEWAAFWKMVKFKMETDITRPNTINLKNGPTVANLNQLFTQVGGAPLLTPSTHNTYGTWYNAFHTSTERDYMQAGTWFVDSRDPNTGFTMNPGTVREDNEDMYVRSFVHF